MRDIFIDTNVAKHFIPPVPSNYKRFLIWLQKDGALVVSQKLLVEYVQGIAHYNSQSIISLIGQLTKDGRLNKIDSSALKAFSFPKHRENDFKCNKKDRDHLKTVLLSKRKLAITKDNNFRHDINNYPRVDKIKPKAASDPGLISYE